MNHALAIRSLTAAMCLAGAAWMSGCDRAPGGGDRPIEITYWTRSWWGDPAQYQGEEKIPVPQWQREQIERFEAMHPNVRIDMQIDPGGRGDKIRVAFAGGAPPDVFHGAPDTEFMMWADLGFLEPIDPYLTPKLRDDIYPSALEAVKQNGKHYAWPLYNHAIGVVINRDLFRERGLEHEIPGPDADWTFDDFRRVAEQLTFDRDGDGRTDVFGVGMHALDASHAFLTAYLINHGADVFDADGQFVLNSDAGVRGLRFMRDMIDEGVATPGAAGYKFDDIRSLFAQKKVAMVVTSAGILIWSEDQVRQGVLDRFDWGFVPLPHVPEVDVTSYLTIGTVFVARQEDQATRDACMAFAKYLTSHEVNDQFWKMASPRRSSPPPPDANLAAMMRQVERAENYMLPPRRLPDRFNLGEEMVRMYQDVLSHPPKSSPRDALDALADTVNRAIAQAAREGGGP
jgi:ABC-type glycerol-3-phosphate transport system substrate-binding protein